jgi:hypothetical protein
VITQAVIACDRCGKKASVNDTRTVPKGWRAQVTRTEPQQIFHFCSCVPDTHITVNIMSIMFEEGHP